MKPVLVSLLLLSLAFPAWAQLQCPDGFLNNSEGGYCEALPGCPTGFVLDSEDPLCTSPAAGTEPCPQNSVYQTGKDRCESKPTCPEGSTFDDSIEKCLIRK